MKDINSVLDTSSPDMDIEIDNGKEVSTLASKKGNLDLVMRNDNWAASPVSALSLYKENDGPDFTSR